MCSNHIAFKAIYFCCDVYLSIQPALHNYTCSEFNFIPDLRDDSIRMRSLGLVTSVMMAGAGLVMTQTPEELCTLASHNVSMMSKDRVPFSMIAHEDTRLYLSLCHQLGQHLDNDPLGQTVNDLCDKTAFACITKVMKGE